MQESAEQRFQAIYRRHHAAVVAYARRRVPADTVEDVVAETFLVCWRRLDHVPDEPLPWLCAVARKTLANQRRTAARQTRQAVGALSGEAVLFEDDPVIGDAFSQMSARDQEVLRLVAWEGVSLREAATVLGCSAIACRVRFHRAKRRLAQRLHVFERHTPTAQPKPDPEGAT